MKTPKALPDEVGVVLEAIRADVIQLHCRWRAFNEIYADSDAVALINDTAPRVFNFFYDAGLTELISAIVRKTDKRVVAGKETLGFRQLAYLLERHGFRRLATRISSRVNRLRPDHKGKDFVARRDPITYYRNNRAAHTNLKHRTDGKSKPLPDLKFDRFETALSLFREMLDITDATFGIHSPSYEALSLDSGRLLVSLDIAKRTGVSPYLANIMLEAR